MIIISGNHEHDNISHIGAPGPHCRKRCMSGRIDKCYFAVTVPDLIRADMLGDTSGLACGYVSRSDFIKKRCFAVVNVSEHRSHNRSFRRAFPFAIFEFFLD